MIRPAKAVDRDEVIGLLRDGYKRSRYADVAGICEKEAQRAVLGLIFKHGITAIDGTHCMVTEENGKLTGLHFAMKQRVYIIGDKYQASEIWFYVKEHASPFAAPALLRSFVEWAESDKRIIEISPACTDVIGDWNIAARMYEKAGFVQSGAIFRRAA